MSRRIFEISMFWNESVIFPERIRNTLGYAEKFYLAEGNASHSGKVERDYRIPGLLERLPPDLRSRVVHVPVDLRSSPETDPFVRERIVRDAALAALLRHETLDGTDVLLIQDFDEFMNPAFKDTLFKALPGWKVWRKGVRLHQHLSCYRLNLRSRDPWTLALAVRGGLARKSGFSPNRWRHEFAKRRTPVAPGIAGWHHSYLGDADFIRDKLRSFAEAEIGMVRSVTEQQIEEALRRGTDLYGRDIPFEKVDYSRTNPIPELLGRTDLLA